MLNRIRALEKRSKAIAPEDCPGPITVLLVEGEEQEGTAERSLPLAVCKLCGSPHVLVIREEIVEAPQRLGGSSLAHD